MSQVFVLAAEQDIVERLNNVLVRINLLGDPPRHTFDAVGVIGCLECLARNPQCLQSMMDLDVPSALLHWIDPLTAYLSLCCFAALIALAHLATNWVVANRSNAPSTSSTCTRNDKFNLPQSLEQGLRMLNIAGTQKVSYVLQVHGRIWSATASGVSWDALLRPFLDLLRSVFLEARHLASLGLAVILQDSGSRDILFKDVGRHCGILQCASWSRDEEVRRYSRIAMDHVRVCHS